MGLDRDVTLGDAGEGGGDAELVDEPLPCGAIADAEIEVVFEAVCLVAPDGPTGRAGGGGPENFEVELGRAVGELEDTFGAGEMERAVELVDVVAERVTLGGSLRELDCSSLLVAVEFGQLLSGLGLVAPDLGQAFASSVDLDRAPTDRGPVASRPTPAELLVERAVAPGELLFRAVPCDGAGAQSRASAVAVIATVRRERGFDLGELAGEVAAADAQSFDAVGEGLIGADTGESDVGPVLVEPVPQRVDLVASPTVSVFMAVVGGLFSGEPLDSDLGGGGGSGSSDDCGASAVQSVVELLTFGATVSGERGEPADPVEVVADVVDSGLGRREGRSGRGELADGVVELRVSIGRLTVEDVPVGCDQLTQLGVNGPRVADGGHGRLGDTGERDRDLPFRVRFVGEPAAEVDGRQRRGVPGVGGVDGAGLGGVAAVGVEGGGAEQVGVVPGAALGAVDGACPGMGHVR